MTLIKSVHIKECWPYEYVPPVRRTYTREAMDRQNKLKRDAYKRKKLLGLKVYELDIDFCERLNRDTSRN